MIRGVAGGNTVPAPKFHGFVMVAGAAGREVYH